MTARIDEQNRLIDRQVAELKTVSQSVSQQGNLEEEEWLSLIAHSNNLMKSFEK